MCACLPVCMHVCVHAHAYVCVCVCVHECMPYVCMYVYLILMHLCNKVIMNLSLVLSGNEPVVGNN